VHRSNLKQQVSLESAPKVSVQKTLNGLVCDSLNPNDDEARAQNTKQ
jgi:hypothetical protein